MGPDRAPAVRRPALARPRGQLLSLAGSCATAASTSPTGTWRRARSRPRTVTTASTASRCASSTSAASIPAAPGLLSKHQGEPARVEVPASGPLAALCSEYAARLTAAGAGSTGASRLPVELAWRDHAHPARPPGAARCADRVRTHGPRAAVRAPGRRRVVELAPGTGNGLRRVLVRLGSVELAAGAATGLSPGPRTR